MVSCCNNQGLNDIFTEKVSRKDADRYRRKGLPRRARKLLKSIEAQVPLEGRSTLEIGVGAGGVTVEMLRRGAAHATGVDAVAAQLGAARELAADFNVAARAEFVLADFAKHDDVPKADVVVMDRVICCYGDWRGLLDSAATHANTIVAMTYPRDTWWMRIIGMAMNLSRVLVRSDFRFYIHPPHKMQELLAARGFRATANGHYLGWELLTATRNG